MDRQLKSPLLIETIGRPNKLSSSDTFAHLQNFLESLPPCPSRTQLERLADALGVDIGLILPAEGERREAERIAVKAADRAEKRRLKELQMEEERKEEMQGFVEGLEEDGEMENGAAQMEGEEKMDDRGDVEYGDVAEGDDDDEDEPDNHDEKMDQDE